MSEVGGASGAGTATAPEVATWIRSFAAVIAERKDELTRLDQAIGDADHGINMDRGMRAVVEKLDGGEPADVGGLMRSVAMTLISKVGGASGPLYGTFFLQFGSAAGAVPELSPEAWADCFDAAVAGVKSRGKAEPGDKTMLDALLPAGEALRGALGEGAGLGGALARAAEAADEGVAATIPLVARKGRASYLGERSAGHQDPGATSSALLVGCAARTWADDS
jgi:phosphoenolpyruvate---glycerone phosphotransferase subunit DhaL